MNKLFSQIIALTKNIWLVEPKNELGYSAQFTAGKNLVFFWEDLAFHGGIQKNHSSS